MKEARDFTYIKPTKRRLSEYEAAEGFAPLHAPHPPKTASYAEVVAEVAAAQRKMVSELGLELPEGAS